MFIYRLALALGKTVPELMRGMTGRQLGEWLAYFKLRDPEEKSDYRTGQICSAIYATHGVKSKPADWMPKPVAPKKQSVKEQIAMLKALTEMPKSKGKLVKTAR